jgi:site-specific recombinase XerD
MPTVIPLDDETRRVLIDWLLIRPDNGDPHLFLTQKGKPMDKSSLRYIWTKHWWPDYEYDEADDFRSIIPHFARHWMSSSLRKAGMKETSVQYLRGDKQGPDIDESRSAYHRYIHVYYDDIEEEYRTRIFKLGL